MIQTFTTKHLNHALAFAILTASASGWYVAAIAQAELPPDWQERVRLGVYAYETGDNRWAFDRFSKLMMDGERKFGSSDGRMARLYTNLGEIFSQQGRYEYAIQCLKHGLVVAEKVYGGSSLQAVPALINLAQVYVRQGNYAQAQQLFKRALGIVDKPGDESLLPYVAVIETNSGACYFAEGNYAASEQHFKRALSAASKSLGHNHKWTTTIGGMYAASLKQLGKTKEAKAVEREAVAKANEIQSPIFIWSKQIALADEAMANKQFTEAETALKLASAAAEKQPEEPMLQVLTLTRYGKLFLLQDAPERAIEKLKKAQALADVVLGPDDKSVLEHAKQLADLEMAKGQYLEAEPLYQRLATKAKAQFGPESEEYTRALTCLADLYNSSGQHPKATTCYSRVLALLEKQYGSDSEKLIPVLVELAKVEQSEIRPHLQVDRKPEEYLRRAEKICNEKFGKNSKAVVPVYLVLSRYYQRLLDWNKAAKACSLLIAANEKNFGPESAETLKSLDEYAGVLNMMGMKKEAESVEARIARIKSPQTTDDH